MSLLILILTGLSAGLLAGLLGIGGGLVIVPVLVSLLVQQGLPTGEAMHIAIATSMGSILLTALGSITAHQRRGAVLWSFLWRYTPWLAGGAWLASFTVSYLSGVFEGRLLIALFVLFAVVTASKLWRSKTTSACKATPVLRFDRPRDAVLGLLIGHLSALLGIGGGSMNAPYFNWRGLRMPVAVGTAAACGYPLALAAAIGFALQQISSSNAAQLSLVGAIEWRAGLLIGVCGLLAAPLGARLAHSMPEQLLRRVFALLLLVLAARLVWL